MSAWTAGKAGMLFSPPPAWLVVNAIAAGGDAAIEWAGYRASRSPYPFAYWLGQAEARRGLANPYELDRAKDAELDAWIEKKARAGEMPGKRKKGKKS